MANSIASSDVIVASAIEVLDDLLAPLANFSLNVSSEYSGRGTTIKVPIVDSSDTARDFTSTGDDAGYSATSESAVTTASIGVNEVIKPFRLSDNELYKSPVNLQNYVQANANAWGLFILQKIKAEIEASAGSATATKAATAFDLTTLKALVKKLDSSGTSLDRYLVLSSTAHSNLLPNTNDVYGSSVMADGRFGSLFGMKVYPTSILEQSNTASKCVAFACAKDGLAIVNRLPETQGRETLTAYEEFTIPSLGLNVAYREFFDASTGTLNGAFTSLFGCSVGNANSIAWVKGA